MSSTTELIAQVELTYTDYTTRTYKIPVKGNELTDEVIDQAKSSIRAFNTAAASASSAVAQTFLSEGGAPVGSINEVALVETTTEDIYNG